MQPTLRTRKQTSNKLLAITLPVLFVLLCAAGYLYLKLSDRVGSAILPPCVFHEFTGLYCTGCGITRAFRLLLEGQVYAAFRMNPLAVASLPFAIWYGGVLVVRLYRGRPLPSMPTWLPWTVVAIVIAYTVARNLPWPPFSWLAPTEMPWVR